MFGHVPRVPVLETPAKMFDLIRALAQPLSAYLVPLLVCYICSGQQPPVQNPGSLPVGLTATKLAYPSPAVRPQRVPFLWCLRDVGIRTHSRSLWCSRPRQPSWWQRFSSAQVSQQKKAISRFHPFSQLLCSNLSVCVLRTCQDHGPLTSFCIFVQEFQTLWPWIRAVTIRVP